MSRIPPTHVFPTPFPVQPVPGWDYWHPAPAITPAPQPVLHPADEFTPVKAGTKTSHVVFILDDSGSMQSCRDATISGFNEFLQGQKASVIPTRVSLYKFDGKSIQYVYEHIPVEQAQYLNKETYNPQGGTNLNDAIGQVLYAVNGRLVGRNEVDRDSVTIVILTDGEENASRTYQTPHVKAMVEKAEAQNWGFFFLGANIDAFAVGSAFGFRAGNTLQYSTAKMDGTMKAAARAVNDAKLSYAAGMNTMAMYDASGFTDVERKSVDD